jgi:hypothetical protein
VHETEDVAIDPVVVGLEQYARVYGFRRSSHNTIGRLAERKTP